VCITLIKYILFNGFQIYIYIYIYIKDDALDGMGEP
jgi:hypothetical protein